MTGRQTFGMDMLPDAVRQLDARIRAQIPLARALDVTISAWSGDQLVMDAPLAPNSNDKDCAFGGSLASIMTLAGWALVTLALERRALSCDVFIGHSDVAYLAPVWKDFQARAVLDDGADWDTFFRTLAAHGKARTVVCCHVHERGSDTHCATLMAKFVAKQRDAAPGKPVAVAAQ